ncbi:NAD(P)-dependent oxidoreductase [Mycolicibacterium flavescens]|uniref:Oxidoreductase n=1 Tax=Mycolicibacterium flavescens TaxID=1776 RepID=A0A1E3RIT9_MYCFV|nr:NAD(P)-dependent oxidoreductase [Mycolicibacterium flavescens]MCV7283449.1 NAD(P)-dependent oxidoreductase [Mycolicibacterium flavescens]ODQ89795.1 oxidoreductase [Mycolicibacterium flavescens]
MAGTVLVTGGFGLVGSATVRQLAADGRRVVAADLDTPANRKAAAKLPDGVEFRWADLTDAEQVERLVSETAPAAVIHLAAVIAPAIYRARKAARKVNVEATATLVQIAEAQPTPPRFVHASSNAVFGARNPHRTPSPLRAEDPMRPCDIYSGTKAEAEEIVRGSTLEWVVLRFGGVLSTDLAALPLSSDAMLFESALPTDNRVQTVDVRDVAFACAAATTADVAGEILLIAGDESHRHCYGDLAPALVAALGMPGAIPPGRPGNPDSDTDWFVTDWMDTTRAQEALGFQRYTWDDMMGELKSKFWFAQLPGRLLAPVVREFMKRRSVYFNAPGQYADPWGAIRDNLGDPSWERP